MSSFEEAWEVSNKYMNISFAFLAASFGVLLVVAVIRSISECLGLLEAKPNYELVENIPSSNQPCVEVTVHPNFHTISDSQLNFDTIERFISDMAKERPLRFSPQQLESFTKNYFMVLGSGGFGVVYKGEFLKGENIAVKVLSNNVNEKVEEQFMAEVSTIGRTYHKNLVRLYGFCFDPNIKALVYEYMENNSLDRFLFSNTKTIEWQSLHKIAVGTAKGIAYLHEECQKMIIHYDIKPGNVLLDAAFNPKVADFGLAKLCNREITHAAMTGYRGTPGYAAPELWKPYPVTQKCDVYSFGMLLFETVGRRRNHDANVGETREWLPGWTWKSCSKGQLDDIMDFCTIELKDRETASRTLMIALWCVQYSPEDRPLMSTVVRMLERAEDISAPPNPFQHLESAGLKSHTINESTVGSSSEISYAVPMRKMFDLEPK